MEKSILWDSDVTVFNKVFDSSGDSRAFKWFRSYHGDCFYRTTRRRDTRGAVADENDITVVRIRCGEGYRPPTFERFDGKFGVSQYRQR